MKKTILVTGGAGYIGSHVCKSLSKRGYIPVTVDSLVRGNEWAVKWGPLIRADISDKKKCNAVIKQYQPAAVIHLAAFAYVGESVDDPAKYYRNNVCGTIALLESMKENKIDKIIFSSSCATYGIPNKLPIDEGCLQAPVNPYGKTKLIIEQMLSDYCNAYCIRSITLRYFNAAGADPEMEIGEVHDPETHLIPRILHSIFNTGEKCIIYGNNHRTYDGTCIRDYIHVVDIAEAHVTSLHKLEYITREVFNLGTGIGYSVKQIISEIERVTGKKTDVKIVQPRLGDPPILVADVKKAEKLLSWSPRYSNIDYIVETAVSWYSKYYSCNSPQSVNCK